MRHDACRKSRNLRSIALFPRRFPPADNLSYPSLYCAMLQDQQGKRLAIVVYPVLASHCSPLTQHSKIIFNTYSSCICRSSWQSIFADGAWPSAFLKVASLRHQDKYDFRKSSRTVCDRTSGSGGATPTRVHQLPFFTRLRIPGRSTRDVVVAFVATTRAGSAVLTPY